MLSRLAAILLLLPLASCRQDDQARAVAIITPLIDPAKLDPLKGKRAANRRLRLIMYHLKDAHLKGVDPATVIDLAQDRLDVADSARAVEQAAR